LNNVRTDSPIALDWALDEVLLSFRVTWIPKPGASLDFFFNQIFGHT
jgi:hypothetical protein